MPSNLDRNLLAFLLDGALESLEILRIVIRQAVRIRRSINQLRIEILYPAFAGFDNGTQSVAFGTYIADRPMRGSDDAGADTASLRGHRGWWQRIWFVFAAFQFR
ncbi:hypothetical protein thsrh120_56410 [Rhizobium sp. No.120]